MLCFFPQKTFPSAELIRHTRIRFSNLTMQSANTPASSTQQSAYTVPARVYRSRTSLADWLGVDSSRLKQYLESDSCVRREFDEYVHECVEPRREKAESDGKTKPRDHLKFEEVWAYLEQEWQTFDQLVDSEEVLDRTGWDDIRHEAWLLYCLHNSAACYKKADFLGVPPSGQDYDKKFTVSRLWPIVRYLVHDSAPAVQSRKRQS